MNLENIADYSLLNLARRNVVLGKNGCGKSHMFKTIEQQLRAQTENGLVRYITPERAGYVRYQPHVEQNMASNAHWMENDRRKNQADNFKEQSVALYRIFEITALRETDNDRSLPKFSVVIDQINSLLDRVEIAPSGTTFDILDREAKVKIDPQDISSGESELISLGIEMLAFEKQREKLKQSYLLIDEPDVHLHPDLQDRLAKFIVNTFTDDSVTILVATHSTALLSALASDDHARVAFMRRGDKTLSFERVTQAYKDILPIFGAHPLSNVFKERPILIVEGEDDERVWQQAVRSADGKVNLFPCPSDGKSKLFEYEQDANKILEAVYDSAKGYSLRDKDTDPEIISDLNRVVRMRFACRAAENLMLSDDVLLSANTNWNDFKAAIRAWLDSDSNKKHRHFSKMNEFAEGGYDRKNADLKEIRNIILAFLSTKPWEVLVGQAIANLARDGGPEQLNSLRDYLGVKVCENLLKLSPNAG